MKAENAATYVEFLKGKTMLKIKTKLTALCAVFISLLFTGCLWINLDDYEEEEKAYSGPTSGITYTITYYSDYSRYNHDSAVETLASLPDTHAYGTNTIRFRGASGSATDGGAINTLTEAEIAVAASKGWTVTLV